MTDCSCGKRSITAASSSTSTKATLPPGLTALMPLISASAFGADGAMMLTKASMRPSRIAAGAWSSSTLTSRTSFDAIAVPAGAVDSTKS